MAKVLAATAALSKTIARMAIRCVVGSPLSISGRFSEAAYASQYAEELLRQYQNHMSDKKSVG